MEYTKETTKKFKLYIKQVINENNNFNITSILDENEAFEKHILDSLSGYNILVNAIKKLNKRDVKIIDIGTGGGFPSSPLMIYDKSLIIDQCDSNEKKCMFLNNMQKIYGFENKIINKNINEFNEKYDIIITRAFSSLDKLFKIAKNAFNNQAIIIAYKGDIKKVNDEVDLLKKRKYKKNIKNVEIHNIEDFKFERNIVEILWQK